MFFSNKKLFVLFVEFSFICLATSKYCNILKCSNPDQHVLCLYPKNRVSETCKNYLWKIERSNFTDDEKQLIISAHIQYNLDGELKWDDDLEQMAQRWAQQCPEENENDNCRSLEQFNSTVYQSVFSEQKSVTDENLLDKIDINEVVKALSEKTNNPIFKENHIPYLMNRIGCGIVLRTQKVKSWLSAPSRLPSALYKPYEVYKHIVCNYAAA